MYSSKIAENVDTTIRNLVHHYIQSIPTNPAKRTGMFRLVIEDSLEVIYNKIMC